MKTEDITNKSPIEILNLLAESFETSRINNDIETLKSNIEFANKEIDYESLDTNQKVIFFYNIGNAWSYIQNIKYPNEEFPLETVELEKQIKYFRKAYNLINKYEDKYLTCKILTNIGGAFIRIGRFSEAIEYFDLCLEIDINFGMAIGEKGFGLFEYGRTIFDSCHQFVFMQYARQNLIQALKFNIHSEARNAYLSVINQIEINYPIEQLNKFKQEKDYYKGLDKQEKEYRQWCAENRLFINPLNDILNESIIANDCLFTPSMVLKPDKTLISQTVFNQLKQEFVSARFLFFESINQKKPHFSDKNVVLMDTLDYSMYSLSLEKMKVSFRVCYSLFDKIAYLINIYLKLGHKAHRVNFRNVWYNGTDKNKGLKEEVLITKNRVLRSLFWLSKDLEEKGFDSPIEPEAKNIATIRNFIEHKSFKIVEFLNSKQKEQTETYEIERTLFYEKTLKILKLSRSAIMYLSLLIHYEEKIKKETMDKELIMPIEFLQINDDEKI